VPSGQEAEVAALLQRARQGDVEALGALLQHCRPYLLFVANQQLADQGHVRPSDIVQDTLLRAMERFVQFRGENPEALRRWLCTILRNLVFDLPPSPPSREVDSGLADKADTPR
jgi:DNA-directed RNA polymerase specialized sigma24 family protein